MTVEQTENKRFAVLHDGLMGYIEHRVPDDEERADDIYEEIIDRLIELTE